MENEALVTVLTSVAYFTTYAIGGFRIGWRLAELWYDRNHPDDGPF